MSKLTKALTAAAGNAGGAGLTVEDVFSTYLYEGNGSTQTITNSIDLDGEGGMVWIKNRGAATTDHRLFDTNRGIYKSVSSNLTDAEDTSTSSLTAFNSSGFSLSGFNAEINDTGNTYASWTFRKAEKFFDVVTWTGDGVAGREIAHNLGSVPACIIIKCTSNEDRWYVYHSSVALPNGLFLDTNWAAEDQSTRMATAPTSTVFTVETDAMVNFSGRTYVAYLFASDAGGFGDDGSESIIKCGSYVEAGSGLTNTVELGFEPQWVLLKETTNGTVNWTIQDTMRGMASDGRYIRLEPNTSSAEQNSTWSDGVIPTATGFIATNQFSGTAGLNVIYIAIRRPMKTPESGTEVFAIDTAVDYSTNPSGKSFDSGFPVDMFLNKEVDQSYNNALYSRLTNKGLRTNTTDSEFNMGGTNWDSNIAVYQTGSTNTNNYAWMFKRATGFFDVVAYTGTGVAKTEAHNLGVVPELMVFKNRNAVTHWPVYYGNSGKYMHLSLNDAESNSGSFWNSTSPTTSLFTVGASNQVNGSGNGMVAYLFASVAGVSKVGSYTGTGSNVDVDCGFSAGARFILIKRTDSTGDWYVWDSVRGIVAGNDPYLLLNSTAAEVTNTDYIDPLSSGFTVTSSAPAALNASGGNYIFLAIS